MCFYIPERQSIANLASEDIPCFKLMNKITSRSYSSWHFQFSYVRGKKYTDYYFSKNRNSYTNGMAGPGGFHSFDKRKNAIARFGQVLVYCTIPKGSYYFHNREYSEYYSNQLIVNKDC